MSDQFSIEHIDKAIEKLNERPEQSIIDELKAYIFAQMLKNADFVQVVRCKDCKHLVEIDKDNLYVCARIDFGMDGEPSFLSPENDFCSRGEQGENK